MGGSRHSHNYFDTWNIRYLPGVKWTHLTDKIAHDKAVREQKLRAELRRMKRANSIYLSQVERTRVQSHIERRKKKAAGGEEALVICEHHAGSIDLLVTDVIMPKLNGRQVADRTALIRPGMRVLYISGYTDDAIVRLGMLDPGIAFLHKNLLHPAAVA